MTMSQIAGNALRQLCRKIAHYRRSGWTDNNRPMAVLKARHDRILARWPRAYDTK